MWMNVDEWNSSMIVKHHSFAPKWLSSMWYFVNHIIIKNSIEHYSFIYVDEINAYQKGDNLDH